VKTEKVHDEKTAAEVAAGFRKSGVGMAPEQAGKMFPPPSEEAQAAAKPEAAKKKAGGKK